MNIRISAKHAPAAAHGASNASIRVEAIYSRVAPVVDGEPLALPIGQTERVMVDLSTQGAMVLEEAASAPVQAHVLAIDGSLAISRAISADDAGITTLTLIQADVAKSISPSQEVPQDQTELPGCANAFMGLLRSKLVMFLVHTAGGNRDKYHRRHFGAGRPLGWSNLITGFRGSSIINPCSKQYFL